MTSEVPKLAPFNPTSATAISVAIQLLQPRAEDVIYDIGCGDGRFMTALAAERASIQCIGVEYDSVHADRASQRIRAAASHSSCAAAPACSRLLLVEGDASLLSLVQPTAVASCGRLLSDSRLSCAQAAHGYAWSVKGSAGAEAGVRRREDSSAQADAGAKDGDVAAAGAEFLPAPATGVFCYLVPAGLARVEPMLRQALQGGARVVTNMFQVPGWAERGWLKQKVVTKEGLPVYLYSLPHS